jgi:hypothetical protein
MTKTHQSAVLFTQNQKDVAFRMLYVQHRLSPLPDKYTRYDRALQAAVDSNGDDITNISLFQCDMQEISNMDIRISRGFNDDRDTFCPHNDELDGFFARIDLLNATFASADRYARGEAATLADIKLRMRG